MRNIDKYINISRCDGVLSETTFNDTLVSFSSVTIVNFFGDISNNVDTNP